MSILVIGSNGFVGRRLALELQHSGAVVQGVSRSPPDDPVIPTCRPEELSSLARAFDCVYLLAAVIPYGEMDRVTPELIESNVLLPHRVVEQFPDSRLVFASSTAVYGTPLRLPIDEGHPFHQPTAYGLSKSLAERAFAAHRNAVSLRFSSIYGPGMTAPTFLPKIIEDGRRDGRIKLFGDGKRTQDYLFVDDAVQMLLAVGASQVSGVFNAVRGQPVSNREAAEIVAAALDGATIDYEGVDEGPSFAFSRAKWDHAFVDRPKVTLAEGVRRMLNGNGDVLP